MRIRIIRCINITFLMLWGCSPNVILFHVTPQGVAMGDTVKVNWLVNGTPSMKIDERMIATGLGDSIRTLEITLYAHKNNKDSSRTKQIYFFTDGSIEPIAFETEFKSDTAIASGIKDSTDQMKNFEIGEISSDLGRRILVRHQGRTVLLDSAGTYSNELSHTSITGRWELSSHLNAKDTVSNYENAPNILQLHARIYIKKQ
ncbi:MAG: hypothetical protein ACJ748_12960 [Flavisolibacter sp.]